MVMTGDGSVGSPFVISSVEDLNSIRNNKTKCYKLNRDLDFNDDASYDDPVNKSGFITGEGWIPIETEGRFGPGFSGVFDGNNKKIKNLYINKQFDDWEWLPTGFFGVIRGLNTVCVVKDVVFEDVNISQGVECSVISNTISSAYLYSTNTYIPTIISNVHVTGVITVLKDSSDWANPRSFATFALTIYQEVLITNCSCDVVVNILNLYQNCYLIVGGSLGGNIKNTIAKGVINLNFNNQNNVMGAWVTGFCGNVGNGGYVENYVDEAIVENCYVDVIINIDAGNYAHNLNSLNIFGFCYATTPGGILRNCYSKINVTTNRTVKVISGFGGMAESMNESYPAITTKCYAYGTITGSFTKINSFSDNPNPYYIYGTMSDCYYDSDLLGVDTNSTTATPKTTVEMKDITTYVNWNIKEHNKRNGKETWYITNGEGYPLLSVFNPVIIGPFPTFRRAP